MKDELPSDAHMRHIFPSVDYIRILSENTYSELSGNEKGIDLKVFYEIVTYPPAANEFNYP